jgi:hypothetical protein
MTEVIETTPAPSAVEQPIAVPENPAIARCMNGWACAYKIEKAKKNDHYDAVSKGNHGYRKAMPRLSGYENIRDFIACVAYGMLIGAIDGDDGTKLLYAAQVALSTVRSQPPAPKLADPPTPLQK